MIFTEKKGQGIAARLDLISDKDDLHKLNLFGELHVTLSRLSFIISRALTH